MFVQRRKHFVVVDRRFVFLQKFVERIWVGLQLFDVLYRCCNNVLDIETATRQRIDHLVAHLLNMPEFAYMVGLDNPEIRAIIVYPLLPVLISRRKSPANIRSCLLPFASVICRNNLHVLQAMLKSEHVLYFIRFVVMPVFAAPILEEILQSCAEYASLEEMVAQQSHSVAPRR